MPYFQDNLDELLAFDGIRNFSGGQARGLQSDLLADNQVQGLVNMTLSPKGNLETRRGILSFSTTATSQEGSIGGMRYYDTPNGDEVLLTVTQGILYSIQSSGAATSHPTEETWGSISRTWGSQSQKWADGFATIYSAKTSMAQFNNNMYMADSDGPLYYYDGNISRRQGGTVRAVTVSGGTGYTVATACVAGPDWSGTSPTLITTVSTGGSIEVTVVDGGSGYSAAPVVTIVGDGSGAIGTATVTPPPLNLKLLINTNNRLFGVGSGSERNTLFASDYLDASTWSPLNSIIVNADDGDEITAIVPFYENRVIVFKKRRIFQVTIPPGSTSASSWTVQLISNNTGCVASASAVQVNSDIFFLSDDGIRSLVRSAADDFTTVGLPISEVVKDVIQTINTSSISVSSGAFYDNRYFLAFPTGTNNFNDTMLVYNTILQAFEGTWTPRVMQFATTNFSDEGVRLMMKTTLGKISKYSGYKIPANVTSADYLDNGSGYVSSIKTKDFNFNDPFASKYGSHFEVSFDDSFSDNVSIAIQRDVDITPLDVQTNLSIARTSLVLPFVIPAQLPLSLKKRIASDLRKYEKWRLLSITITSSDDKMAVRQIVAAANPDTIEIQKSV